MRFYTPLGTWVMDVEGCLFSKNLRIFVAVYTVQAAAYTVTPASPPPKRQDKDSDSLRPPYGVSIILLTSCEQKICAGRGTVIQG